jgi:hypothetical protein
VLGWSSFVFWIDVSVTFVGDIFRLQHTYFCSIDCERVSTSLSSMNALSSASENAWAMVLSSSSVSERCAILPEKDDRYNSRTIVVW